MIELFCQPLDLQASWPIVAAATIVGRLDQATLFIFGLVALATFSLSETYGVSPHLFPEALIAMGPVFALAVLCIGLIIAVTGAVLGENLTAALVAKISTSTAKCIWALITAPFVIAGSLLFRRHGARRRKVR